jgi:hypothetical protein
MDGLRILPGSASLWGTLSNKFGWSEPQIFQTTTVILRRTVPGLLILILGGILLYFFAKNIRSRRSSDQDNLSIQIKPIHFFWILGVSLSLVMGYSPQEADCGWDVIASYEAGGDHLEDVVPEGSKIYWNGGLSAVPLLYLSDYQLYPPQINNGYTFHIGGDPIELTRYGWWNEELAREWQGEADVILVEDFRQQVDSVIFDELSPTAPIIPCKTKSEIHIYLRR